MRRFLRIIRNVLLVLIAAIVAVAAVLAFNVFSQGSRQLQVAAVPKAQVDAQAAPRALPRRSASAPFLPTKSRTSMRKRCAACRRISKRAFRRSMPLPSARTCRRLQPALHLGRLGPERAAIALLAHQDVVPVAPGTDKSWQYPPWDGVIADGFIWGRGSWDDKGNSTPCWMPPRR